MSDAGRQNFTDKAGAALKPDSQKSATEQAGDYMKGAADSAARAVQPNSNKSGGQKAGDSLTSSNSQNDDSLLGKAKNAMGMGEK
ncbi:heat shock protein 9/12-domain-containing protein [Lyophyllum atratum]|nr:heat shock protein 9/12-domain-containing protein [Lyophyllum atratum]